MSERYDLKLYRMESEEVNDTDTRFHLKYLLTDKVGCTKKEVTLDEITGLMNTLHNSKNYYFRQTRKQNDRINLLEESLRLKKERIEDLESFVESLNITPEQAKRSIMIHSDSEGVIDDLYPLFKELLDCFNCIHESNNRQYENNLIMLNYHVKGFKEVCKE